MFYYRDKHKLWNQLKMKYLLDQLEMNLLLERCEHREQRYDAIDICYE